MSNQENLVRSLNSELEKARHAYYVLGDPVMSDAEYDTKEAQLLGLVKTNPELAPIATVLQAVGDDATGKRVKHIRQMLSIENKYDKGEIVEFFRSLPSGSAMAIEPKRDGISCELRYRNRKLVQALTRGDGKSGEDITAQVLACKSVPKTLEPEHEFSISINVRGELVMRTAELERINALAQKNGTKTYASTRNLAAGTMKLKDASQVSEREILFVPWDLYTDEEAAQSDSRVARLKTLEKAGFPVYDGVLVTKESEVLPALEAMLVKNNKSEINADGVVVKADSLKLCRELGVSTKVTNYQCCFKPQSASGTTYLRNIVWQVGRQGKLTPVAECDPVVLAGARVTRASLNNETWIATMGLKLGAKVEMLRSGDVIPQIIRVLDETGEAIVPPKLCPECGSVLEIFEESRSKITTRWCQMAECPGRVRDYFTFIGSREVLEIDGLAEEMSNFLVKSEYARNLGELFEFQSEALNSLKSIEVETFEVRMMGLGFPSGAMVTKMVYSLEKAKKADWDKWIAALGIPMISRQMGKVLATTLKLQPEDIKNLPQKLKEASQTSIEGLGEIKNDILLRWSVDPVNQKLCMTLYENGIRPTSLAVKSQTGATPLSNVAFCITGEFTEDRESITRKLESLGAIAKSGVSKNINTLIVGTEPGKSKLQKFIDLTAKGIKIEKVGVEWLEKTFAENGMELKGASFAVEEV